MFVNGFIDSRFVNHCTQEQGNFDLLCMYTIYVYLYLLYTHGAVASPIPDRVKKSEAYME
jgi:hypothetical protein